MQPSDHDVTETVRYKSAKEIFTHVLGSFSGRRYLQRFIFDLFVNQLKLSRLQKKAYYVVN